MWDYICESSVFAPMIQSIPCFWACVCVFVDEATRRRPRRRVYTIMYLGMSARPASQPASMFAWRHERWGWRRRRRRPVSKQHVACCRSRRCNCVACVRNADDVTVRQRPDDDYDDDKANRVWRMRCACFLGYFIFMHRRHNTTRRRLSLWHPFGNISILYGTPPHLPCSAADTHWHGSVLCVF